ncbi:manganese-dependent inorganic pyrophosphatase [Candidatus Woesebacteria bacterium]|nr:MAG: manganese-dependent inorganic pyrophosphatase [Candidatus Woesebacteria bacterium]
MPTKIFGHKAPDTDTICSAVSYAWFLNQKDIDAKAYRLGDLNKETQFVLENFNVPSPDLLGHLEEKDKVVIVDTNNPEELPDDLQKAEIIQVIDHHKLTGGIKTNYPIPVIIKPLASTATIIWKHIKHSGIEIDLANAGLLLAGIISDTLNLTSPTTTEKDRSAVKELNEIVKLDINEFAGKMFEAKGDLTGMSPRQIVLVDSKIFEFGTKKVRISVLETTKPDNALNMQSDLEKDLQELKLKENLDFAFFFAVDILNSRAVLISGTNEENNLAEEAFNAKFENGRIMLPGVVSRKKQIVPVLQTVIEKL